MSAILLPGAAHDEPDRKEQANAAAFLTRTPLPDDDDPLRALLPKPPNNFFRAGCLRDRKGAGTLSGSERRNDMPNGADYLPPGTTYADLDAHFGGPSRRRDMEDLTADEQRARRLAEPYHHGYCETCAEEAGELVPRLNCARRCATCIEQDPITVEEVEAWLRDIDKYGWTSSASEVLAKVLPLLGSAKLAERQS